MAVYGNEQNTVYCFRQPDAVHCLAATDTNIFGMDLFPGNIHIRIESCL